MILDGLLLFSTAQAVTATAASTNIVDLTNARDMGIGNDYPALKLMVNIGTTFTAAGAATMQIQFQGSTDATTWTTYAASDAMAVAGLTAGNSLVFPIDLPGRKPGAALPLYYRLNYVIATGPMTAGAITATLVLDRQWNHSYPAGLTVAN